MANLRRWSSSASGNSSVAGGANTINFAEGQTPGSVNNSAREMMAQVRSIYTPAEWGWVEHSATASVASQTTIKLSGNQTSDWTAGRRWRLKSGSSTRYGSVVSSSFTAETTITVTVDSGSLSASHSLAALSPIDASSNQLPFVTQSFLRNRIINGDMRIDQRNAGGSITPTVSNTYTLDRWQVNLSQASKFSIQQNAGAVTPPAGFKNYAGITSLSAYAVLAGDFFSISSSIEGYNVADFGFGAAGAQSVTLSFWVRSSLTGSFGASFTNSAGNRSYPFSYTISSANTWEQKVVTIAGDTSGTWLTDNGIGLIVRFSLGCGATFSGTAGAWTASNIVQPTGSTSIVGTNAATFYVTGVQLEAGSVATPFERRQYGQELALCQRYYEVSGGYNLYSGPTTSTNIYYAPLRFSVTKRAAPTIAAVDIGNSGFSAGVPTFAQITVDGCYAQKTAASTVASGFFQFSYTAAAEL